MTLRLVVAALLAAASVAQTAPPPVPAPLSEDERILHVLSRLTYGPRPGDVEAVKAAGLDAWIARQLDPASVDDAATAAKLAGYETLGLDTQRIRELIAKRAAEKNEGDGKKPGGQEEAIRRKAGEELRLAIAVRMLGSERQLLEVLADFWRNHFNVDLAKDAVLFLATNYEEAVIRPNVLGRFSDMLEGTARHPAMLLYLDNALSRKPPPKAELRQIERRARKQTGSREAAKELVEIAKQSGLNENYARELMELHTLGVDNGYTQKDVTEVARAFTGWTVDADKGAGTAFVFKEDMHDSGQKTVLGKPVPVGRRDEGITEGEAVLKRLAAHENCSAFIARKLVRWLVDDVPPEPLVERAAKAFRRTKGDLKEVVRAIVTDPEFYDRRHFRAKFKTPLEFVVSALRATNATVADPGAVVQASEKLGLKIYGMEDPTGWSDAAEAWRDPGVMALRWKFALTLTDGQAKGLQIPPAFFDGLPEDPLEMAQALARRIVPAGLGSATAAVLERVVFQAVQAGKVQDADGRRALARRVTGILLGSPEFQQQ